MADSYLDRLACAIFCAAPSESRNPDAWGTLPSILKEHWRAKARAALKMLRNEPSEAMTAILDVYAPDGWGGWEGALDAALEEDGNGDVS